MQVQLTIMIQRNVAARDEESYAKKRDRLLREMERRGFFVSVESEETVDGDDATDYIEEDAQ